MSTFSWRRRTLAARYSYNTKTHLPPPAPRFPAYPGPIIPNQARGKRLPVEMEVPRFLPYVRNVGTGAVQASYRIRCATAERAGATPNLDQGRRIQRSLPHPGPVPRVLLGLSNFSHSTSPALPHRPPGSTPTTASPAPLPPSSITPPRLGPGPAEGPPRAALLSPDPTTCACTSTMVEHGSRPVYDSLDIGHSPTTASLLALRPTASALPIPLPLRLTFRPRPWLSRPS